MDAMFHSLFNEKLLKHQSKTLFFFSFNRENPHRDSFLKKSQSADGFSSFFSGVTFTPWFNRKWTEPLFLQQIQPGC